MTHHEALARESLAPLRASLGMPGLAAPDFPGKLPDYGSASGGNGSLAEAERLPEPLRTRSRRDPEPPDHRSDRDPLGQPLAESGEGHSRLPAQIPGEQTLHREGDRV